MKKPIKEMKYEPYGLDNEIIVGAWLGLVRYAVSIEVYRDEFKKETGIDISNTLKSHGINAMIDQTTGYQKHAVIKWADWVTKNLWGVAK